MSWNIQGILDDAVTSSTRAIQFDRDGQYEVALFYYREAAKFLELAILGTADGSNKESLTKKAAEYKERAQALDELSEFLICSEFDGFYSNDLCDLMKVEYFIIYL